MASWGRQKQQREQNIASQKIDKTESMYSCLAEMKPKKQACDWNQVHTADLKSELASSFHNLLENHSAALWLSK